MSKTYRRLPESRNHRQTRPCFIFFTNTSKMRQKLLRLKKILNASKPSEHSRSQRGKNIKRLGEKVVCKDKNTSWALIGFLNGSSIGGSAV